MVSEPAPEMTAFGAAPALVAPPTAMARPIAPAIAVVNAVLLKILKSKPPASCPN
jgi:hypothetical protein